MDARKSGRQFEVGDLVLLKFTRHPGHVGYRSPKEDRSKIGPSGTPLRIVKKPSPLTYKLALPMGSQMHDVVSAVHLCKYGKDAGEVRPLPIIEDNGIRSTPANRLQSCLSGVVVKEEKIFARRFLLLILPSGSDTRVDTLGLGASSAAK